MKVVPLFLAVILSGATLRAVPQAAPQGLEGRIVEAVDVRMNRRVPSDTIK